MAKQETIEAAKLWVVLARCHHAMATYVERSVEAEGLCLSDFMVLEVLLHKGPLPISAIGEKVLLASASMTSAVDRLDKLGLVTRSASEHDRRTRLVVLTNKGAEMIREMYRRHVRQLESLMGDISQAERKQFYKLLKTLGFAAVGALSSEK
jgi:MarR family 2-MHQ and catechol resistance regulon transcriptional repressor